MNPNPSPDERLDPAALQHEWGLRAALRALPDEAPPADLWQRLAPRLEQAPPAARPPRGLSWWSLAACTVLVVLGFGLARQFDPAPAVPGAPDRLAQLQQESERLEQRLAGRRQNGTRWSLRAAELERTLADGLALTDLQLSAATGEAEVTELWQRRVALLSTWLDLGAIGPELGELDPALRPAAGAAGTSNPATNEEPWL